VITAVVLVHLPSKPIAKTANLSGIGQECCVSVTEMPRGCPIVSDYKTSRRFSLSMDRISRPCSSHAPEGCYNGSDTRYLPMFSFISRTLRANGSLARAAVLLGREALQPGCRSPSEDSGWLTTDHSRLPKDSAMYVTFYSGTFWIELCSLAAWNGTVPACWMHPDVAACVATGAKSADVREWLSTALPRGRDLLRTLLGKA
jgi:hypothetical protein